MQQYNNNKGKNKAHIHLHAIRFFRIYQAPTYCIYFLCALIKSFNNYLL